jgi:formylmethanofuran dehydrogenase subunit E
MKTEECCEVCGRVFSEEDLDMLNGKMLCRDCEDYVLKIENS